MTLNHEVNKERERNCVMLKTSDSRSIAEGIWSLTLKPAKEEKTISGVEPGQFIMVYPKDASTLLPRPLSICDWDEESSAIRLVFRLVGKGTQEFAQYEEGELVRVLGPLGRGYDLSFLTGKKVLLVGGGIGAPPLLFLARTLYRMNEELHEDTAHVSCHEENRKQESYLVTSVLGYRTNDLFLADEFQQFSHVIVATDDGSAGIHGNAVEAARKFMQDNPKERFDAICACGPHPMLSSVKKLGEEWHIPVWVSLEERMACGVGVCLGCTVETMHEDEHSHVKRARVCTEGPVFRAEDVIL